MSPVGSIQPWLVSVDDDSLSDAISIQHPIGTRTLSKPELQSEHRGPGEITAAELQICWPGGEVSTKAITQISELARRDAPQTV